MKLGGNGIRFRPRLGGGNGIEWNVIIIREQKGMEWNRMYLSKRKEWKRIEQNEIK